MSRFAATLGTLIAFAGSAIAEPPAHPGSAQSPGIASRPNIVFIMSDDHCRQAISCYGASAAPGVVSTPGIDRIAREGIRFDQASVTNAICGPSRAVMLTGLHSHRNGFVTNDQSFDGSQRTFVKLLRGSGYRAEIVGKWHLGSDPQGFDHFDVLVGQGDYWSPTFIVDGVRTKREGHATDIIHANAISRLDALADGAKQGTPFALLVHHKAPHRNWMPQPRFFALFGGDAIPEPATLFDDFAGRSVASTLQTMSIARDLSWEYDLKLDARSLSPDGKRPPLYRWMANELARLPEATRAAIDAAYRDENTAFLARFASLDARARTSWRFQRYAKDYLRTAQGVDESVGGILDELDRLGIADNTIVVYTSDQGWFLGEHGWYDKRWMYEESFRTPLVVRWHGVIPAGKASLALVQNLYFAPTFLEAAGVAVPADMQGKSMVALLKAGGDESKAGAAPFREATYYRFEESKGPHTVPRHEGVATANAKLIRFLDLKDADGAPLLELYDLSTDPDERRNLADDAESAGLRAEMLEKLEEVRRASGAPQDVQSAAVPAAKPNIVLFVADDLGQQDVSVPMLGEVSALNRRFRTPNLEALAARGVRFSNAYAAAPVCTPSRAAILSGQSPARTHITYWTLEKDRDNSSRHPRLDPPAWQVNGLQPSPELLPALMRAAGYRTIHVGKAHWAARGTDGADPTKFGFDINIAGHAAGAPGSFLGTDWFKDAARKGRGKVAPQDAAPSVWDVPGLGRWHGERIWLDDALAQEAAQALAGAVREGRPFFLSFAPYGVHTPIMQDDRFASAYPDLDPTERAYATMVAAVDDALGRIVRHCAALGVLESTVFVFTSDNGGLSAVARGAAPDGRTQHAHNAPLRSGKGSAYEGGLRVPFVLAGPGIAPRAEPDPTPIIGTDLYPTLLGLADADIPPGRVVDGVDFGPLLRGTSDIPARSLLFHQPHAWGPTGPGIEPFSAIRHGDWKLIWFHDALEPGSGSGPRVELFDVSSDPSESVERAEAHAEKRLEMLGRLRAALGEAGAQYPTLRQGGGEVRP